MAGTQLARVIARLSDLCGEWLLVGRYFHYVLCGA